MIVLFNVKITDVRMGYPYTRGAHMPNPERFDIFKYCLASTSVLEPLVSKFAFYITLDEKNLIEAAIQKLNNVIYTNKIVTEVTKLSVFYEAEDYHQNYEKRNPYDRYVRNVSIPRLKRFQKKFPELLKATH